MVQSIQTSYLFIAQWSPVANGYILGSVALQREEILEVSLDKSQHLEVGYRENFKVEEQPGKRSIVEEKSLEK